MRQSFEHVTHLSVRLEAIDSVHDLRVVRGSLHVPNNWLAVLIVARCSVELASKAVGAVTLVVHVGPSHADGQDRIGKGAVDHTASEARLGAISALAVAAEAGVGVKYRRVLRVLGVAVDTPVPVWLGTSEPAFITQEIFVQLDVPAVPREEVGHKVDLVSEREMGVDQVVQTGGHGVDVGVFLLGKLTHTDGGSEVLGLFGVGELAPLLADGGVSAAAVGTGDSACGGTRGQGEEGKEGTGKHGDEG